jgi:hypothetical protein
MPNIYVNGHFAVVSSTAGPAKWKTSTGLPLSGKKRMALLEVHPHLLKRRTDEYGFEFISLRVDQRLKSIKRVIYHANEHYINTKRGWHAHNREWLRLVDMADSFEKLWPLHMLSKRWPLPLPDHFK